MHLYSNESRKTINKHSNGHLHHYLMAKNKHVIYWAHTKHGAPRHLLSFTRRMFFPLTQTFRYTEKKSFIGFTTFLFYFF